MLSPSHTISSHRHLSFARLYTHEKFPYTVKLYCIKIRVHSVHCKASSTCALFWVTQLRRRTFSFRRHWFSRQASQSTCMRAFSLSYFGSREVTASETRTYFIIKKTNQGLLYHWNIIVFAKWFMWFLLLSLEMRKKLRSRLTTEILPFCQSVAAAAMNN